MNQYAPPQASLDHDASSGIFLTNAGLESLKKTKGWTRLFSILLFIGGVFTVIAALAAGAVMLGAGAAARGGLAAGIGASIGITLVYGGIAMLYLFLAFYLYRFSKHINELLLSGDASSLDAALASQHKFWRLAGVLAVIMLVFFVLGTAAAIVIPAMSRMS